MNTPCRNPSIESSCVAEAEAGSRAEARQRSGVETASACAPRRVTTGRKIVGEQIAHVDWLAFTLVPTAPRTHWWVVEELSSFLGPLSLEGKPGGRFGYTHKAELVEAGLLCWGGDSQRGTVYVSLNAQGCSRVIDWAKLKCWLEDSRATITRVDLAHDDMTGESVSVDLAESWVRDGLFNVGGRNPKTSCAGDWLFRKEGRTLYIGSRGSGKMLRIYEKGKQLGGGANPRWVRVEVELKNQSRTLRPDILIRPGAYLVGAYPNALGFLSATQEKIRTIKEIGQVSYRRMVENLKQHAGKALNVMMEVEAGDAVTVVQSLVRPGVPARLAAVSYHMRESPWLDLGGHGDASVDS